MLKLIFAALGVLSVVAGIIVVIFLERVSMESRRVKLNQRSVEKQLKEYTDQKKREEQIKKQSKQLLDPVPADDDGDEGHDVEIENPENDDENDEGADNPYKESLNREKKTLHEVIGNEGGFQKFDSSAYASSTAVDFPPLIDDLKLGSKIFVDRFIARLQSIQDIKDQDRQEQLLKMMEFQLFQLKKEKLLKKEVQKWAQDELEGLKFRMGREPATTKK